MIQTLVEKLRRHNVSSEAKEEGFETDRDMKDFVLYESRDTRSTLSQGTIGRLKERYQDKFREVEVFDRMGDRVGDGPAFYLLTAMKAEFNRIPELKIQFPTFVDLANHVIDERDKEISAQQSL